MYQQPYESCSRMVEIGLIVLIQFVWEWNEAINRYFNMQSNPGVSVCYFHFLFFCFFSGRNEQLSITLMGIFSK